MGQFDVRSSKSGDGPGNLLPAIPEAPRQAEAERRQLTVMFVDLVGSTALSETLDPEDMAELIRRYQNTVAHKIPRYDGQIAKYMGDGGALLFWMPKGARGRG